MGIDNINLKELVVLNVLIFLKCLEQFLAFKSFIITYKCLLPPKRFHTKRILTLLLILLQNPVSLLPVNP